MPRSRVSKNAIKKRVWHKTGGVCAKCGKPSPEARQTIDHYIPKSKGGTYDMRNLVPLCKKCNKLKASQTVNLEEYYPYLQAEAIADAKAYEAEWKRDRIAMSGDIYGEL